MPFDSSAKLRAGSAKDRVPAPNGLSAHQINSQLKTQSLGRTLHLFDQIPSTNDWAMRRITEGGREGEVVIADAQTAGKGRLGRTWLSPAGKNIYLSAILQPKVPLAELPRLTLVAGVAAAEALSALAEHEIGLQWPNDLVHKQKKLGGILCEASVRDRAVNGAVVGIGIDVNMAASDFPAELQPRVTSLQTVAGRHFDRNQLIARLMNHLESWYQRWLSGGWPEIIVCCNEKNRLAGKKIRLSSENENYEGIVQRIDEQGQLELKLLSGTIKTFWEGDTTLL